MFEHASEKLILTRKTETININSGIKTRKTPVKQIPVERVVYRELPMDGYIEKSKYEALERV